MRRRLLQGHARIRIHEMLGEMLQGISAGLQHRHRTLSQVEGGHHGIPDPLLVSLRRLELIDHKLNEMALVAVQGIDFIQRPDLAVNPDFSISTPPQLVEKFPVVTLPASYERSEEIALPAFVALDYKVHDLSVRVPYHLLSGHRGICP